MQADSVTREHHASIRSAQLQVLRWFGRRGHVLRVGDALGTSQSLIKLLHLCACFR